jgi:ATP-binding cassette subfamily B protein
VVIKAVCNMLNERFAHIAAYDILYHIRIALAQKLGTLPLGYFNGRNVGDLKKVLHEDVEKMEEGFAHLIPSLISGIVTPLLVTLLFFITDWRMALATIITLPLILMVFSWMYRRASSRFAEYNEINVKMNAAVIQYVNGMKVIKAFTQTNVSFAKLRESIETMTEFYTSYMLLVSNPFALIQAMVRATLLTIVPIGAYLVLNGSLDLPTLALFLLLGIGFNQPLFQLFFIAGNAIWQVNEAGKRILAIFDTPSLSEPAQPQQPRDSSITFRNVSFSYTGNDRANGDASTAPTLQRSNAPTLNNVSFTIPQGSVTALVGPSGAGKTTIARLIPRFWDVGAGAVLLGGVNIKNVGTERLMEHIAFVFQDVFLFNDTVAANIRIGKPNASDDDIIAAAKLARCHEFISELPQGYQTNVGENGQLLSCGQRQRLSIARAILKDAPIVLLDEATASIDPENERLIQEAFHALAANKTLIIIAHRLNTIQNADQILALEDGRIAQRGRHAELLAADGLYRRFWAEREKARGWKLASDQVGS